MVAVAVATKKNPRSSVYINANELASELWSSFACAAADHFALPLGRLLGRGKSGAAYFCGADVLKVTTWAREVGFVKLVRGVRAARAPLPGIVGLSGRDVVRLTATYGGETYVAWGFLRRRVTPLTLDEMDALPRYALPKAWPRDLAFYTTSGAEHRMTAWHLASQAAHAWAHALGAAKAYWLKQHVHWLRVAGREPGYAHAATSMIAVALRAEPLGDVVPCNLGWTGGAAPHVVVFDGDATTGWMARARARLRYAGVRATRKTPRRTRARRAPRTRRTAKPTGRGARTGRR